MREIKFRAWAKEAKVMHPVWTSLSDENGKYELLQYTGLKDINGKEIYEGDIVKYKVFTDFHDDEYDAVSEIKYIVEEGGRVGFSPMIWDTKVDDGFYNYEIEDIEVIGNIWENPELLKV